MVNYLQLVHKIPHLYILNSFNKTLLVKAVFFDLFTVPYSNVVPNRPE